VKECKKIETDRAPKAIGPYSQAVGTDPFIFVSGQLPLDPMTGKMVESDIAIQINRVLDNLEAILNASGCSFQNVVRCDLFLKDLNDFSIVNQEYGKRFNQPVPPARQTIQVARLPLDALIEISCIAYKTT
jgi:2-iminobutanoate/2-iminopropanoate deaminase